MNHHYPEIAVHVPTLLLPRADVPLETWAVIACDQFTSQPEYWEEVRRGVGAAPSGRTAAMTVSAIGAAKGRDREVPEHRTKLS